MAKKKSEPDEESKQIQIGFRLPEQLWKQFAAIVDALPYQPSYVNVVKSLLLEFIEKQEGKKK